MATHTEGAVVVMDGAAEDEGAGMLDNRPPNLRGDTAVDFLGLEDLERDFRRGSSNDCGKGLRCRPWPDVDAKLCPLLDLERRVEDESN
ncbi:hypothetical protein [Sinorhizobium medicae]|uniref:hypothetical protein n=1 Tax=Sinorhizobium medicae TaxID=110321 RepID=UPI00037A58F2|nr:hypothetical protein [Sinorhizobium medicae]